MVEEPIGNSVSGALAYLQSKGITTTTPPAVDAAAAAAAVGVGLPHPSSSPASFTRMNGSVLPRV